MWILGLKGLSEKCIGGADKFLSFHDPELKEISPKDSDVHRFRIKINFLLLVLRVKYCLDRDMYLEAVALENSIYSLYNLFVCI